MYIYMNICIYVYIYKLVALRDSTKVEKRRVK